MKRPRPYIPILVRLKVAQRQFSELGASYTNYEMRLRRLRGNVGKRELLTLLLKTLFPDVVVQLDHDPALILRPFNEKTGKYTPDACDPDHLIWREKALHQEKTTGRRPGATHTITTKGSDIGIKTKFARLEKRRVDTSDIPETGEDWFRKAKTIPSRRFPRQRRSTATSSAASKKGWRTRRKMDVSREKPPKD